jgi:septum formation protein
MRPLILASASSIRAQLLRRAGVVFHVKPAQVDEEALRESLVAEGAAPRDVADTLAEAKAWYIASRHPQDLVLGCDQVLDFQGILLGKPGTIEEARERLLALRGQAHKLYSAAVLFDGGRPVWRHVSEACLTMRQVSDDFVTDYLTQIGDEVTQTVGAYAVEGLGIRLMSRIDGDYFGILGLPLTELLNALVLRGDIDG